MNAIFANLNSHGRKKQRQQSAVEFLSTYSWTFLVLAMLIAVLLIFISQKSPVNYLLNQCFLTSQITCLQDIITTNSTNILFAAKLNNYLGYSSLTYLQFGANSINVTLTGIGKNGTNIFYGNCYPMNTLVPYAGQTFCIVKIPKQLVPKQGQKISATYQISYNICTSGEKCVSSHSYSQSGYTYLSFGGDFAEFVALSAGMPTPQNPIIGIGQSVTLHEDAYGGITPYTFAWFSGQSSNCTKDSLYAGNVSQITVSPSSSTYYCYSVSDNYNQYAISPADFVQVVPPPAQLPNEVFTYGTQHTLTATAQLGSDTIEILVNNKVVASGTGTASYTICSTMTMQTCLANATYSVEAYEVQTNEYSSPSVLTIQKAAPQLSLNSPSNFQYTGSGGTINYGIGTLGNQALAMLYVNGGNAGSTYTSASYTTSASAGTYNIYLQTNGNQNYTAASRSASFTIRGQATLIFSGYWSSQISAAWRSAGCCNWWAWGWDYGGTSQFRTLYNYISGGTSYSVIILEGYPSWYAGQVFVVPTSYLQNLCYACYMGNVWSRYTSGAIYYGGGPSQNDLYNTSFAGYPGSPNGVLMYSMPITVYTPIYKNVTTCTNQWVCNQWGNCNYGNFCNTTQVLVGYNSQTELGYFWGSYTVIDVNSNTGIATVSLNSQITYATGSYCGWGCYGPGWAGGAYGPYQNTLMQIPASDLAGGTIWLNNGTNFGFSRVDSQLEYTQMPGCNGGCEGQETSYSMHYAPGYYSNNVNEGCGSSITQACASDSYSFFTCSIGDRYSTQYNPATGSPPLQCQWGPWFGN